VKNRRPIDDLLMSRTHNLVFRTSFRAFVEKLDADAEQGEADETPIVEEGTEGVRVMTVHKAKGSEFPVVVLADPTCSAARDTPGRHVEPHRHLWVEPLCGCAPVELLEAAEDELRRDRAEATRVAYVAATRARDLLVAAVCGDEPVEGWLDINGPCDLQSGCRLAPTQQ
jgi:ATP-dependent helicase/nuclease subunit A